MFPIQADRRATGRSKGRSAAEAGGHHAALLDDEINCDEDSAWRPTDFLLADWIISSTLH